MVSLVRTGLVLIISLGWVVAFDVPAAAQSCSGQFASGRLCGNSGASQANPGPATLSAFLDRNFSSTQGALLYRGSSAWGALAPGTAGQTLLSGGPAANPLWGAGAAGSIIVGTTTVSAGTSGRVLYDNAGVLGEYTATQLTAQINLATNSLKGALPAWPNTTSTFFRGDGSYQTLNCAALSDANAGCSAGITGLTIGSTTISGGISGRPLYDNGGLLAEYTVTGTGAVVFSIGPTLDGPTILNSLTATGLVKNSDLVNASTTVNGQTCTLGSSCTITASAGTVTVGTTTVASGTDTRVLFDNAGVLGEYVISGSGNVAMTTSPSFTTPTLGVASATSINKVAVTAPATSATLTIADGKTATFSNSITMAGTDSTTMTFPSVSATITRTVASGAKALATSAISSATCSSAQTDTATGVTTSDAIIATFSADPTSTTGYDAVTTGRLSIAVYPTADTVNFKVCNNTLASITPGAVTVNWRVVR